MRLLSAAAIALLLLAFPAAAQIAQKNPVSQGSVTPEVIGQRLEDTAERTRAMSAKGAARSAIIDFAWPQDAAEYKALGKYVLVFVSAVSQQADELPLKRVYVESNGREITLERIASVRREVPKDTAVHAMLGPHREDAFYIAPADRKPTPAANAKPDPKALKAMLEREYTGFSLPEMVKADAR